MRSYFLLLLLAALPFAGMAQDFPGYSASPYAGSAGLWFNPATAADNVYSLDFLVAGASVEAGNNFVGIRRADIRKPTLGVEDLKLRTWNTRKSAFVRATVLGPGVMVSNEKSGWGFNVNLRNYVNVDGVNSELAQLLAYGFDHPPQFNDQYRNQRLNVNAMSWAELAFTYAVVLRNGAEHYLSAGIRPKILFGLAAVHVDLSDAAYNVPNDSIIQLYSGALRFMHSDQLTFNNALTPSWGFRTSPGLGLDAGLIYEFRPDDIQKKSDQRRVWPGLRGERAVYKYRIGLALQDLGIIRFRRGELSDEYTVSASYWNTNGEPINQTAPAPVYGTFELRNGGADAGDAMWMRLPLSLNLHGDYQFRPGLYVGGNVFSAVYLRNSRMARVHELTRVSITPRYENEWFGVWAPVSFSRLGVAAVGGGMRIGPLSFGTNDILGLLFARKYNFSADAYIVLKLPLFPLPHRAGKQGKAQKGGKVDECAD
ncbi:MAG: DUF5723 family protein [Bacteroidia bacterium]|jgi:hypothetical protein|nr:DUF5723 family protein [Bacteroidia bacterium]